MKRVVIAGTGFGRIYIDAVRSAPASLELAGILGRGSSYSQSLAEGFGVPFFSSPDDVPGDVDIVCVVLRSGVLGGPGAEIAQTLLRRGFHVLQEHPVHPDEIADCLRAARVANAAYAVHTLYSQLRPVRRFIGAAQALQQRERLAFLDASTNSQVVYPLLEILGLVVGGLRPWRFGAVAPFEFCDIAEQQPFSVLHAVVGGVPLTLRVQNQIHPDDGDNHSHLLHRIAIGTDAGVLSLADTHGPVLWNPRLHAERDSSKRLILSGPGSERLAVPSTVLLGNEEPSTYHDVFAELWPDAVLRSILEFCADIDQPSRRNRTGQSALAVARAWQDLTSSLGPPELIRPSTPEALGVDVIESAVSSQLSGANR